MDELNAFFILLRLRLLEDDLLQVCGIDLVDGLLHQLLPLLGVVQGLCLRTGRLIRHSDFHFGILFILLGSLLALYFLQFVLQHLQELFVGICTPRVVRIGQVLRNLAAAGDPALVGAAKYLAVVRVLLVEKLHVLHRVFLQSSSPFLFVQAVLLESLSFVGLGIEVLRIDFDLLTAGH